MSLPTTLRTAVPTPTSNMRRNAGVENMIISQPTILQPLLAAGLPFDVNHRIHVVTVR
jgi:hypothetical protein